MDNTIDQDLTVPGGQTPDAAKASIEAWAERKGMLPQILDLPGGHQRGNPDYWKFAATKAFKGWPEGTLVTEEEFDTAVREQAAQVIR